MRILLIISSFNSLSQKVYVKLKESHQLSIKFAISNELMIEEVERFKPDIILCPYLKKFVPKEIFTKIPTFIIHPGIVGDRGHNSLDHAILGEKKQWGVVVLRANEEYDGGAIYSEVKFDVRHTNKASLYRNEVCAAALKAIDELFINLQDENFEPLRPKLEPMHETLTQEHRQINWQEDTTDEIIKKIHASDSFPGVKDNILELDCFLYGVSKEEEFKGKPKEVLAKRDGAICLGTIDGAIWISHMKEVGKFKLPATYVLKDRLKGIKERRIPLIMQKDSKTFHEITSTIIGDVAYLYFDFYNGAMDAQQCVRLKYAVEHLSSECKVLVLMGGDDYFSNGIHLNILEDSKKQGEDGWSNINAINDVVKAIIFNEDIITVASFGKNAGAGGVFLGLACDYVISEDDTVLNPHYKTLGLTGSEYHTYSLPKRVGKELADRLLNDCLPVSSSYAKKIGMIDEVIPQENYFEDLNNFCQVLVEDEDRFDDFIDDKRDYLDEHASYIDECKEKELRIMHPEFWDENSSFHKLRYDFVHKVVAKNTPKRLKDI